jgi:hypothetical protein
MSFLAHSLILADVAPEAGYTRNFDYCLKISNLKKYPNHLFFSQVRSQNQLKSSNPYLLIKTDKCISANGYLPVANITAIAKNKVRNNDLQITSAGTILKNTKLQKSLIKSTSEIEPPRVLPVINEGKQIEAIYKIQSIDRGGLHLVPVKEATPILNLLLFPLMGITLLGWFIWRRKQTAVSQ